MANRKKQKTNEEILIAMIKNLSPIELALLRERIYSVSNETIKKIDNMAEPETGTPIISKELVRSTMVKIRNLSQFEEEKAG